MTSELVDKVIEARVGMIRNELAQLFPNATIEVATQQDGRALIKMIEAGYIVGMEFVETASTWDDSRRQRDYYIALVNKCRLGVIVPKEHAMSARMKLLEFNQRWLFYYQVFSYDEEGNLKRIGRPHEDGSRPNQIGNLPGYV